MASSQVEIMFTSSPFGCDAKLNIIRDHLNNLPISSDSAPVENTHKPTWVSRAANKNNSNLKSLSFTRRFNNLCGDHKDDSSSLSALMSPRHSQIIDRWAARQAQEVVHVESLETIHSRRQVSVSPPRSDGSSESEKNSILGASSLVQMWEKRLNKSNSTTKQNTPLTSSPIRTSLDEENCRISEESESSSFDEQFPDWESDKTDQSCSSKVLHCSDVVTEREGRKIADIIKRLAVTNNDENDHDLSNSASSSPYRERGSVSTPKQLPEHKGFCQLTSSPRIRGRQAFNDLMMQFESDRHGELNSLAQRGAVSKFRQRGRIQSLLRLRLLQRGVAAFDPSRHNHKSSAAPEVNKQQEGSAIIQLKERFNMGDDSSHSEVSDLRSIGKEKVNSTTKLENFPTSNQLSRENDIQCEKHTQISMSQISSYDKLQEAEAHPSLSVTFFEDPNHDLKDIVGESPSMADSNENEAACDKVEVRDQQYDIVETSYNEMVEEDEASEHNCDEAMANYDWISNISRPRSYWEERRQEWYSEMLDFGSDNDERRRLLERKTVSTVLSSDFRERIDKLMKSHMGTQTHLVSNQYNEEDQEESMEQLMAFFQEHLGPRSPQKGGREREEEEEVKRNEEENKAGEQEEESITSISDHELCDYHSSPSIHTPSSSTWSYRDNDGGDDSDRVAYVSSPLPSQSQSLYQDAPQYSSSTNHPSIEMEFIYDLRGQMEQLFREMTELRKSIKSCTDMQMQIQQSKNQEVHTVKEEKKFDKKTSKKGNCCICHEKKVNSVLYRCGHMCACLKCANELQWKSGKCPICQAQIIDVVRVYTDT